jgi:hypothetical protein
MNDSRQQKCKARTGKGNEMDGLFSSFSRSCVTTPSLRLASSTSTDGVSLLLALI